MSYKKLIRISAAGAGKTYQICQEAISEANEKRALLVTYTNKGVQSIKHELAKMNAGFCLQRLMFYLGISSY